MTTAVYAVGYVIVLIGVAYLMHLMHLPQPWIVALMIILLGLGMVRWVQTSSRSGGSPR